ncbi:ABC transporter permease [Candidatus Uhrbacteria bacterium]|nr:ABC transporter permease [Candidatus Uhrbacteria bacterium]
MITSFNRIIRFSFQNFWRNAWLSFVTISILTLTLLSVNFFVALNALFDYSLLTIEEKVNITVHFQQTAQENNVKAFLASLSAMPDVASTEVRTKEEALEKFRTTFKGDQHIQESLQELENNPLPSSVIIRAKEIQRYDSILAFINDPRYQGIIERQTFVDRTKFIERLQELKINARRIGAGVTIFFALIAALIVVNTIRMTIFTRRREVGIMKLVGATNRFIRAPLFLEGIWYSIASVLLTILIVFPLISTFQPYLNHLFENSPFDMLAYFSDNFGIIFGSQFAAIVLLNTLASFIAIGRYLKV